jgi:hypothetical protein
MRALVVLGICTERDDGAFELTRMGTYLAANSERSLRAWALVEATCCGPDGLSSSN